MPVPAFPIQEIMTLHGVDALYTSPEGDVKSIKVVLDKSRPDSQLNQGSIANCAAAVMAIESDVETADNRAILLIDSVTYKVVDAKPDGTGFMIMYLSVD